MAGNEDRGGIQELIALIKDTSIPIICMCNDRNAQKMRSLVNYCFDLRFQRPRVEQIKGAMMSVCFKEKLKLAPGVLDEIIASTNHDIRQTLNILSMLNAKKDDAGTQTAEDQRKMSIHERSDLFFHDYSLGPLFVQENYLKVSPRGDKNMAIFRAAEAADCLSQGDLIERRIRSNMAWSLLPTQAIFSSVLPGYFMQGFFTGQIEFPGWLGKNSKRNKRMRLAQEINDHIRISASASREAGPWDVVRKVFSAEDQRKMSIHERSDLFFHDYSLGPLFVQENYLKVSPRGDKNMAIFRAAEAADCLSQGDLIERRIRSNMAWSLLPTQAIFSSVLPGYFMQGFFTGQIEFPGWLGKNSKRNKRMRLAQDNSADSTFVILLRK
uniref:Activator 1 large subunit n=1 Tax=Phlebotomus papatasi TaxID=29031 RepID=A0A1B0DBH1_PHLPP